MGLSVRYGSIILECVVLNIDMFSMFIAPMPMRSYVGLGLGYRCIILEYGFMNISVQHMIIAPLPIWSYVGLGLGSRCIIVVTRPFDFKVQRPHAGMAWTLK